MGDSRDPARDAAIRDAPNSDPTGGGPPPAGAVTRVTSDGQGITQGAAPGEDPASDESPAPEGESGADAPKISNGVNARPRNESISSSERGLPSDSSTPVEISPEEERALAERIREM